MRTVTTRALAVCAAAAGLVGLGGLGVGGARAAVFSDVTLGTAGPGNLNFGVFVTGPTTLTASNPSTLIGGNVGLASGASTNFTGGGTITGALYADPGATVQSPLTGMMNINGGVITQSLSQAVSDVTTAWQKATSLSPNSVYLAVGSSPVTLSPSGNLNGLGGRNTVVNMQSINITLPGNNLTITGNANDWYIINVGGSISVSNGQIVASGGIPASHILFTISGSSSSVNLTNGSSLLTGTFLAPLASQQINLTPGSVIGAVIGYTVHTSSGPQITGSPWQAVPTPGAAAVVTLGAGIGLSRRRRSAV